MRASAYFDGEVPNSLLLFLDAESAGLEAGSSETALKVWSWLIWKARPGDLIAKKASARSMARVFGGRREKFSRALEELRDQRRIRLLPGGAAQLCRRGHPGEFMQKTPLDPMEPVAPAEPVREKLQKENMAPMEPVTERVKRASPTIGSEGATLQEAANPSFVRIGGHFEGDTLIRTSDVEENEPTNQLSGDELRRARSIAYATPGLKPKRRARPGKRGGQVSAASAAYESLAVLRGVGRPAVLPNEEKENTPPERADDAWPEGIDPDDPYACPPLK